VHPTDQHPNEKAHKLAAEAIAQKIRDEGWPPQTVQ
jgi:lysophospholipase L1-like esterase